MQAQMQIINLREHPEMLDKAADYFASKWGIDKKIYAASIKESIETPQPLPRWYLLMQQDRIIGSFGLIENDFMQRQDLKPWLCALFIEADKRGNALGAKLLAHGRCEARKLGFKRLYLCTDLKGYYEKYGWQYFGLEKTEDGDDIGVYAAESGEAI